MSAFSPCWTELFFVILNCLEECADGFFVGRVDSLFSLSFEVNKVAVKQGLKVMRDHALFLPKGFGEFIYAHRLLHQLFYRS